MNKITLGVLFGGVSSEHDISTVSAKGILSAIDKEKYDSMTDFELVDELNALSGVKIPEESRNAKREIWQGMIRIGKENIKLWHF